MFKALDYFDLYSDEDVNIQLQKTSFDGIYLLHCDVDTWNTDVATRLAVLMRQLSADLLLRGVFAVYAMYPVMDTKGQKFARNYGFYEQGKITGTTGHDFVLLRFDCEEGIK